MITCGDSITVGTGASPSSKSWVGLYTPVNIAVSGAQAGDLSNLLQTSAVSDCYSMMIGTNDVRIYKDTAKKEHFKRFLRCALAWLSSPIRTNARDMTITGTWANTSVNSFGRYTTANGATIKTTVTGSKIFVGYIIQNSTLAVSTANVFIDGVNVGTISCDGNTNPMNTQNGATYAAACDVFCVEAGAHEVEIVNTSPNGKYLYINWVTTEQTSPAIKISNIIKLGASTYTSLGITSAVTDSYNTIINDVLADFSATLVDNYSDIDPATHLSDGVHPNNAGHLIIHNNFKG